jgi:hypothetical protein
MGAWRSPSETVEGLAALLPSRGPQAVAATPALPKPRGTGASASTFTVGAERGGRGRRFFCGVGFYSSGARRPQPMLSLA